MNLNHTALLVLEDGTTCYGKAFGAIGTTGGEICFNTGMTGYQEVFTDPSYYGQVLIMNSVHIGNYGVNLDDIESDSVKIKGLIGRNLEELFSRKMASVHCSFTANMRYQSSCIHSFYAYNILFF